MVGGILAGVVATPATAQDRPVAGTPAAAAAILAEARRASDTRRMAPLRQKWTEAVRRNPTDRSARLGLAHLDFYEARFDRADSVFASLTATPPLGNAIALQGWIGRSMVAGQQGMLAPADSFATTALRLARQASDSIATASALLLMAQFRARAVGAPAALTLLTAADSFVSAARPDAAARVACARAQILNSMADTLAYREAIRGLALLPRGTGSRSRASCLFTVGQTFHGRGGRFGDSSARYFRLAATEQAALGDGPGRAGSLQWLGATLTQAGRYTAARRAYEEALSESERSRNRSPGAWALLGMGQIFSDLGDDAAGVPYLMRATRAFRDLGDLSGFRYAQQSLLTVRLRRGDTLGVAAALPEFEAISQRLGDRLARQRSLALQVDLARTRGDRTGARRLAEELWAQFERDRQGADDAYALVRGVVALEAGALDVAATHLVVPDRRVRGSLRDYVVLARAAELAARRGDLGLAERRLREAHAAFADFRSTLSEPELRQTSFRANAFDQVDPDLGVATVINALATGGRVPAAFGLASDRRARELTDALTRATAPGDRSNLPGLARARASEAIGGDTAVRAVLRSAEAMLFYVTGARQEPTTVFVVTRDRVAAATVMGADSLQPLVSRLRRLLEAGSSAETLRRELGAAVLGPAARLIPSGVTRLLIVGDGPLQAMPFDALRLPDGRTMLDAYDVALLASPAVLPILRGREPRPRSGTLALAVEQPGRPSPLNGRALPALRRANREAQSIVYGRRGSAVLTGDAAREAVLYQRTDQVAALHIAAHAVVDPVVESRSAIMLSGGGGQDGDLHAWEMGDIGISAGLVVLSACRTQQADAGRGEGLRGFTAPFLLGGAQAVVATQWDLSDRAASQLMGAFHRQLQAGADAGTALLAAKREQLRRGRPPSEWAVFQLVGDPGYRFTTQR
ncbi:MAG: CHAT domain-containing tetratricopeptide repeat protein [Gemmatimonadaceae bacterium]|nr:CHAT domain-containing tetratricopeptide repeat protein [Gemmatimonadaceae bacterium]